MLSVGRILQRVRSLFHWLQPRQFYWLISVLTAAHVIFALTYKTHPGIDGDTYQMIARRLHAAEDWLACGAFDNAYWPPLFCIYLAGFWTVFGTTSWVFFLGNIAMALGIALLSVRYLQVMFDAQTARWAGLLCYASMLVFYFTLYYKYELLAALLLSICMYLLYTQGALRGWRALLAGAALGLAALATGRVLSLLPAFIFPIVASAHYGTIRRRWVLSGLLVAGVVLGIAPWTARNYACFDQFIPITNNSGMNFYMGFNPVADGSYSEPNTFEPPYNTVPLDDNATFYRGGVEYIAAHPGRALALLWRKIRIMWRVHYLDSGLFYPFFYVGVFVLGRLVPPGKKYHARGVQLMVLLYTVFHMLFIARYYYLLPILPLVYGVALVTQRAAGRALLARGAAAG